MFLNELKVMEVSANGHSVWKLTNNLLYRRGDDIICVPYGFETDYASVPRVPIVYAAWGDRAHREAVLHDYAYRIDSYPHFTREDADLLFKEAMISRGQPWRIYYFMWLGVWLGGGSAYHKRKVHDSLIVK